MSRLVLSNEEKETLISFDETPTEAVIFTYNKRWQQHLEKRLGLQPTLNNEYGGKEYHLPKSRIRLPLVPRHLSAEQRQRIARQLSEGRHQKALTVPKNHVITGVGAGRKP